MMESRGLVAPGDLLREVVAILFQAIAGVEVGFFGAVRNGGEVADTEVDTCCLVAGCGGRLDFVLVDEMQFPSLLRLVVENGGMSKPAIDGGVFQWCRIRPATSGAGILLAFYKDLCRERRSVDCVTD